MNVETVHHLLRQIAWVELALCWAAWLAASFLPRGQLRGKKIMKASKAWLGIVLNLLGVVCIAAPLRPAGYENSLVTLLPAMVVAPPSVLLVWAARRHLGRQWHCGAVIREDQELIKTGPYAGMRHPIYASLLGMVLATGGAYSWWPFATVGAVLTLLGIEIRVKAEEHLLETFFQDEFIEYRARTRSFFPVD